MEMSRQEVQIIAKDTIDNLLEKISLLNEHLLLIQKLRDALVPSNFEEEIKKLSSALYYIDSLNIEIQKELKKTQANLKYAKKNLQK